MTSSVKMYNRVRKPNYTQEETLALLEQLHLYKHLLFRRGSPGALGYTQRADVWARIVQVVNAVPNSAERTVEELKHRWKDMSHRGRTTLRMIKEADTLGKTILKPTVPFFDIIMSILGDEVPEHIKLALQPEFFSSSHALADPIENFESMKFLMCSEVEDRKPDVAHISSSTLNNNENNLFAPKNVSTYFSQKKQKSQSPQNINLLGTGSNNNSLDNKSSEAKLFNQNQTPFLSQILSLASTVKNDSLPSQCDRGSVISPCQNGLPDLPSADGHGPTSDPVPQRNDCPMILDPHSQRVVQIKHTGEHRTNRSSVPSFQKTSKPQRRKRLRPTPDGTSSSKRQKISDADTFCQETASAEELKRCYYINKIEMVREKREFIRLQEMKLHMELRLLQHQLSTSGVESSGGENCSFGSHLQHQTSSSPSFVESCSRQNTVEHSDREETFPYIQTNHVDGVEIVNDIDVTSRSSFDGDGGNENSILISGQGVDESGDDEGGMENNVNENSEIRSEEDHNDVVIEENNSDDENEISAAESSRSEDEADNLSSSKKEGSRDNRPAEKAGDVSVSKECDNIKNGETEIRKGVCADDDGDKCSQEESVDHRPKTLNFSSVSPVFKSDDVNNENVDGQNEEENGNLKTEYSDLSSEES